MRQSHVFVLGLFLLSSRGFAQTAPPEFRAVWVTRFEWASENPEEAKANIVHAFDAIAEANLNAAVFQIRGEADTLYPSTIEPWSELLGGRDPGFDPVALAIQEAHKRGIQFHAYINAMPLRSMRPGGRGAGFGFAESRPSPAATQPGREPAGARDRSRRSRPTSMPAPRPPAALNHLWYSHGPDSPEPWVCMDAAGQPSRQDYYYMSAGIPDVQAYLRRVIMDVVRRYDVDGIHLDRIRYPGPEYVHDRVSEERFHGRGNPNLLDRGDWQREQLDKLINDLAAEVRAVKPKVVFSCSAWGIYNRYHIPGYAGFSSGYHDYYQDTWNWCRLGAMDVLMPMIYWDIPDPRPNYDELMRDFVRGVGRDRFVGGQSVFSPDENIREIEVTREVGALGTVLFSLRSAQGRGILAKCRETIYAAPAAVPTIDRVTTPKTGGILGIVTTGSGKPLVDAWVSLRPTDAKAPRKGVFAQTWTSGADGRFAFLDVPPGPVQVRAYYVGAPPVESPPVRVKAGEIACMDIAIKDAEAAQNKPFVQVLSPKDGGETTADAAHVLGRTSPGCKVKVGGADVEVYATGAFARDRIALAMGSNAIEVTATDATGRTQTTVLNLVRKEATPPSAPKEARVVEPAGNVALLPGDALAVKVVGPPGCTGSAACLGSKLPLAEAKDDDGKPACVYTATIRAQTPAKAAPVRVTLRGPSPSGSLECRSRGTVEVWNPAVVRIGEAKDDGVGITLGLHEVRLGGPWLARVPRGTRFEIVGRQGSSLKVALSASMRGWVSEERVERLAEGTPVPRNYFTSCDIDGDATCDRLTVGLREKVVVAVRSETIPANRLVLDFFNTHDALTWISHKSGAKVIGTVVGEQIEDGRFRLTVPVKGRQIWGCWTETKGNTLTLCVRRPPAIAAPPASPLKGLLFALEAGHGGSGSGAVGHLGTKEKEINLAAVRALQRVLEDRGAKTVEVRPGDSSPSLSDRVQTANDASADFFVAIHANAAGNARGFLAVSGTSTYYKDEHCRLPAELVYRKLLGLGWGEFGVVGNFSYSPLQNTRMPSILIEQAFMSNPSDEARLLDPEYQRKQALAVADALEQFVNAVRE